jgi:uncharacterized protein (TIGR02452 family)
MSLKEIARQTLEIIDAGHYLDNAGERVDIASEVENAISNTRLYRPDDLARLLGSRRLASSAAAITVTNETTQVAARRLAADHDDVVALNFASARNPGGGFIRGAKAQEEDVARCSALYPCLQQAPEYYQVNRAEDSLLYTDHIIYSPAVPFFRERSRTILDEPFCAGVITAPAPNAGEHLRRHAGDTDAIQRALDRRAGYVLAIAKDNGHRCLVLGAWGCGVFKNDPWQVADVFGRWLDDAQFADAFDRVDFAVYDPSKAKANLAAFTKRFG